jgi:broad specificity phosphatase PhoE
VRTVYYVTHPEVVQDPLVPVTEWRLSERGVARMAAFGRCPFVARVSTIYASDERKAVEGATILARRLGVAVHTRHDLGENDRSATGYLPPPEFEATADLFFARPHESVRGWERACDAQARIVRAIGEIANEAAEGDLAIVAHGGVGALLLCHLAGEAIARAFDQPGSGGGNYFAFAVPTMAVIHGWRRIEDD